MCKKRGQRQLFSGPGSFVHLSLGSKILLPCIWSARTNKDWPLSSSPGARDPRAAQYRLCLVMFNLDNGWNKNHNSEPWNKDAFLLSTSSITVHCSELRKIAQTFRWNYSFLSCLKLRLPFDIMKIKNSVHRKMPLKERKRKAHTGKMVFAKPIC